MDTNDTIFRRPEWPPPKEPAYSEDGVDLTLIRSMLAKTPEERLEELRSFHEFLEGFRKSNPGWTLAES